MGLKANALAHLLGGQTAVQTDRFHPGVQCRRVDLAGGASDFPLRWGGCIRAGRCDFAAGLQFAPPAMGFKRLQQPLTPFKHHLRVDILHRQSLGVPRATACIFGHHRALPARALGRYTGLPAEVSGGRLGPQRRQVKRLPRGLCLG